jgi:beta-N-acetylhexosaminidase
VAASRTSGLFPALVAVVVLVTGCRSFALDPVRLAALEPDLGQLLLVGFNGTTGPDNAELERLLCQARVGGVLIFGRNVVDAAQVKTLTTWMRERARECAGRSLLVATDAEGGQVMRLGPRAGYTATLSHQELGEANDLAMTELEARRIARMLREAGISWDLAPVVDVGYNPANPVIVGAGRSFSANPGLVTAHARAFIQGMHAEGMLTALKHFPGHGSSYADSHQGFVDVTDTANPELELAPYRVLLAEQAVDSIMTAHVVNRRLDLRHPATLSRRTIDRLLRRDLGWDGVVVSDDLRMGAIEQHYGLDSAAVRALRAGVDVLLVADDRLPGGRSAAEVAVTAIRSALAAGRLDPARVEMSIVRVRALAARAPD